MKPAPLCIIIACIGLVACGAPPPDAAAVDVRPVSVRALERHAFRDSLAVVGSVAAERHAVVSARVPGVIDALLVSDGQRVVAGQTPLFRIDQLKLSRARSIAEQDVVVAEAALVARQADERRLAAERDLARIDHDRFQRLFEQDHAVSQTAFEQQRSRLAQVEAACQAAAAASGLAAAPLAQARLGLEIAEKDLADSQVLAPIDGVVSETLLEAGEMAGPGLPVLRIDEPRSLEVSALLPARAYARVQLGQTRVVIRAGDGLEVAGVVSYRAAVIDEELRCFEIRCLLGDPPAGLVPGTPVEVEVVLAEREALAVPLTALLERRDGPIVFQLRDGQAERHAVTAGLRDGGLIEIAAGLDAALPLIVAGQTQLVDGEVVRVVEER
jgi:HlyD family secretion protein